MKTPTVTHAGHATRLGFFVAGFAIACWAPLIPFVKTTIGVDEAQLGLLILCLGLGSVVAMTLTGVIAARIGARPMILGGGVGLGLGLPLLIAAQAPWHLALLLPLFGAALGTLDVAINIHAVEVERRAARPLMSGFHALFSFGGILGAGSVTGMLWLGLTPLGAATIGGALALALTALAAPGLYRSSGGAPEPLSLPRGIVIVLALLALVMFLVEGAVLDWGALLLLERALVRPEQGGLGFLLFSITMTIGRFTGDALVARVGALAVLIGGGLLTVAGIALAVLGPGLWLALAGFGVIGFGAANLVPILFSAAGRQRVMPVGMAIAAVTTTGYGGMLLGPAAIGLVAEATSLVVAFGLLAVLVLALPLAARRVVRG